MKYCVLNTDSINRSLVFVVVTSLLFIVFVSNTAAQKPVGRKSSLTNSRLRVWIPSGFMGANYWVYLNGRLKSSPPYEAATPRGSFNVISLHDRSGWEVWTSEGRLTSSLGYEDWLKSYLASGDKYNVFHTIEYGVAPGKYTVEIIVSTGGEARSLSPLPFAITRKYQAVVRPGQTLDVYTGVPLDWYAMRAAIPAAWASPCNSSSFDLKGMQASFLAWARSYQNDPLVKLLHRGRAAYTVGSPVLELMLAEGPREFDGLQIERIIGEINVRFSNARHDHNEITNCKRRFPEYSRVFDEYDKTISLIDDDLAALQKLATDLKSNR